MQPHNWTIEQRNDLALALARRGISIAKIAEKFKTTARHLYMILAGHRRRDITRKIHAIRDGIVERARGLLAGKIEAILKAQIRLCELENETGRKCREFLLENTLFAGDRGRPPVASFELRVAQEGVIGKW